MDPVTAVIMSLTLVIVIVLVAMLVNVVGSNLIRQRAYYRDNPTGDFAAHLLRRVKR